jgi:uncharacterized membrane protein
MDKQYATGLALVIIGALFLIGSFFVSGPTILLVAMIGLSILLNIAGVVILISHIKKTAKYL